jgi:hypothetical protein
MTAEHKLVSLVTSAEKSQADQWRLAEVKAAAAILCKVLVQTWTMSLGCLISQVLLVNGNRNCTMNDL